MCYPIPPRYYTNAQRNRISIELFILLSLLRWFIGIGSRLGRSVCGFGHAVIKRKCFDHESAPNVDSEDMMTIHTVKAENIVVASGRGDHQHRNLSLCHVGKKSY